jgi:hypothetical protein
LPFAGPAFETEDVPLVGVIVFSARSSSAEPVRTSTVGDDPEEFDALDEANTGTGKAPSGFPCAAVIDNAAASGVSSPFIVDVAGTKSETQEVPFLIVRSSVSGTGSPNAEPVRTSSVGDDPEEFEAPEDAAGSDAPNATGMTDSETAPCSV